MTVIEQRRNNLARLKGVLENETMKRNFENILKENAGAFTASIIELFQSDKALQECEPNKVVLEALKAATLKLPLTKALGFAYIIPYKEKGVPVPQFQLGYRGLIQLAQRSGQYRYINADVVYEGEKVEYNKITGGLSISGVPKNDKAIGYFAYFQLLNGFEKSVYWTKEQVTSHAKRYSRAFNSAASPWQTEFDAMAIKTVLKSIISKYGIMSVEFANALAIDSVDNGTVEVEAFANQKILDIPEVEAITVDEEKPVKSSAGKGKKQAEKAQQPSDEPLPWELDGSEEAPF